MAQNGLVIHAKHQNQGRGQRGKIWQDHPGNLKFSIIIKPPANFHNPFYLSIITSIVISQYLISLLSNRYIVSIKWPNDIYINDKKACGLLIENTFRGPYWQYAVIGIGLNVNQEQFSDSLGNATSLYLASGEKICKFKEIITNLRAGILNRLRDFDEKAHFQLIEEYNSHLYQRNNKIKFLLTSTGERFEALVLGVSAEGKLRLKLPEGIKEFSFGSIVWLFA